MLHGHNAVFVYRHEGGVVGAFVGKLAYSRCLELDVECRHNAVFGSSEINRTSVGSPCKSVNRIVPVSCGIAAHTCGEVEHEEAVAVALISVVLHGEPCQRASVGRECRCGIVAHHALGKVLCRAAGNIVGI